MSGGRSTIVHVLNTLEGGGTERVLASFLRASDPALFRHVVVTLRHIGAPAASLPHHVACRPLDASGRDRLVFLRLAKVLAEERAALVHARNTCCWFDAIAAAAIRPRISLVLGFHGLQTTGGLSTKQRRLARWAARLRARFTTVSHSGRRRLAGEGNVPPERITVLPNGVDIEPHPPCDAATRTSARAELGFDEGAFLIGAVGSLTPIKRFDLLIDALADLRRQYPHAELLLVGDGPLRDDLTLQAERKGVQEHVHLIGHRDDVPSLLRTLDAYACSSDSEEMSNALLEAMAAGLPVVTTDVGDHALVLRDGREGFVVRPGDSKTLADRISRWIDNAELRSAHGRSARVRAADFDFARTVRAYEDFYAGLLLRPVVAVPVRTRSAAPSSAVA